MTIAAVPGGTGRIGQHTVARIGYGAMQLDESMPTEDAVALLRTATELGINHIDTASFYAGGEVNRRIRQALAPYRDDLVIVSKVGAAHPPHRRHSAGRRPAPGRVARCGPRRSHAATARSDPGGEPAAPGRRTRPAGDR